MTRQASRTRLDIGHGMSQTRAAAITDHRTAVHAAFGDSYAVESRGTM